MSKKGKAMGRASGKGLRRAGRPRPVRIVPKGRGKRAKAARNACRRGMFCFVFKEKKAKDKYPYFISG